MRRILVLPFAVTVALASARGVVAEDETPRGRVVRLAAAFGPVSEARGFRHVGRLLAADGTAVGRMTVEAKPGADPATWHLTTEQRWTRQQDPSEAQPTWKPAEVTLLLSERLTPTLESLHFDGSVRSAAVHVRTQAVPQGAGYGLTRTLGDEPAQALAVAERGPATFFSHLAATLLFCRHVARTSTEYELWLGDAPLRPDLLERARLKVEGVGTWKLGPTPRRAWIVTLDAGRLLQLRLALDPDTRTLIGLHFPRSEVVWVPEEDAAAATDPDEPPAARAQRALAALPAPTPDRGLRFQGDLRDARFVVGALSTTLEPASVAGAAGWRLTEEQVGAGVRITTEALLSARLDLQSGRYQVVRDDLRVRGSFERVDGGIRLVRVAGAVAGDQDGELEQEHEIRAPAGTLVGLAALLQFCRHLPATPARYEVTTFEPLRCVPPNETGLRQADVRTLGERDTGAGESKRKALVVQVSYESHRFRVLVDAATRAVLALEGVGAGGYGSVQANPSDPTPTPAGSAAGAAGPGAAPGTPVAPGPPGLQVDGKTIYMVEWRSKGSGSWYRAYLIRQEGDKYLAHYEGESEYARELVTIDRIRPVGGGSAPGAAAPTGSPVGRYALDPYLTNEALKDPGLLARSADWAVFQRLEGSLTLDADGTFEFTLSHKWSKQSTKGRGTWKADGGAITLTTVRVDEVDLLLPVQSLAAFDGTTLTMRVGANSSYPYVFKK